MSTFKIDGHAFGANGEGMPGWAYNYVKDWYDFDQDSDGLDARVDQNGSYAPDQIFSTEATPSLEGVFYGDSAAEVAMAKLWLRSLRNDGREVSAEWDDHGVITRRRVFVKRATPTHSAGRAGFRWAIDMLASDPGLYGPQTAAGPVGVATRGDGGVRFDEYTGRPAATGVGPGLVFPETYGETGTSTGRLTLVNPGLAPAWSTFTFVGGSTEGFTITRVSTGETVAVGRSIHRGAQVVVNFKTGRVTIDGDQNDISGYLREADWWQTPASSSEEVQLGILGIPVGTPTLSSVTDPAY